QTDPAPEVSTQTCPSACAQIRPAPAVPGQARSSAPPVAGHTAALPGRGRLAVPPADRAAEVHEQARLVPEASAQARSTSAVPRQVSPASVVPRQAPPASAVSGQARPSVMSAAGRSAVLPASGLAEGSGVRWAGAEVAGRSVPTAGWVSSEAEQGRRVGRPSATARARAARVVVGGVGVDPLSEEEVVGWVARELAAGRGGRIVTP